MSNQSMFNTITREFQYGDQQVVIETGRVARQANSIMVHMGGVTVLVAAVVKSEAKEGRRSKVKTGSSICMEPDRLRRQNRPCPA